jgi:hypothetical protein
VAHEAVGARVTGATPGQPAHPAPLRLLPGPPARVVAVLAPLAALALVVGRALSSGLSATSDDPVSPWIVAVVTVAVGFALAYRALTQSTELGVDVLRCRNLLTTFDVDWDRVEDLEVVRRGPFVMVEVRIRSLRRRHRLGAATRFVGDGADVVLDVLRAHPRSAAVLVEEGAWPT